MNNTLKTILVLALGFAGGYAVQFLTPKSTSVPAGFSKPMFPSVSLSECPEGLVIKPSCAKAMINNYDTLRLKILAAIENNFQPGSIPAVVQNFLQPVNVHVKQNEIDTLFPCVPPGHHAPPAYGMGILMGAEPTGYIHSVLVRLDKNMSLDQKHANLPYIWNKYDKQLRQYFPPIKKGNEFIGQNGRIGYRPAAFDTAELNHFFRK